MRPGNPLGDYAQRAIGLPLILKPVVANEDGVAVATPLTDQCRARFERGAQIGGRAALFALSGQSLQAALQCPAGSAIALLLELMNEGSDQQIAAEPLGWFDTMQLAPGKAQIVRRPMQQFGNWLSTSAITPTPGSSFGLPLRPGMEDGPPECWRAEVSWRGGFMRSPVR